MNPRTLRLPLIVAVLAAALFAAAGSALGGKDAKDEGDLLPVHNLQGVRVTAQEPQPESEPETETTPEPEPTPAPKPQPKPEPRPQPKAERGPTRAEIRRQQAAERRAARRQAKAEARRRRAARQRAAQKAQERAARKAEKAATADLLPAPTDLRTVPNFVIQRFRIPIFLLPIYQAAGIEYGVRWEVLAAINEIETDYGRNLNVSYAGAQGWMQFMPATWKMYGTDANRDGERDPYNPVDAIFAAAKYLKAAGAETDLRRAIFAYNHADWYVDDVMERAEAIAQMPTSMVGALTGLADGRFPVRGHAEYDGALDRDSALERVRSGESPARVVTDSEERDHMDIEGEPRAKVISVSDGIVQRVITSKRGRRIGLVIEDSYGNRFSYYGIRRMEEGFEVPGRKEGTTKFIRLKRKAQVPGGTLLGRLGRDEPVLTFGIRPAGEDSPLVDPKPMLDGWRLLEQTAVYRPSGKSVLHPDDEEGRLSIGQAILLPKTLLARRVLADSRIQIYPCGRTDIEMGRIDRRVLAVLVFLAESGMNPTVTSLQCGHGTYTTSGNVSYHSMGSAVDIAAINGVPILGHQEPGGVTDRAVRAILTLQGAMVPAELISLLDLGGPSFAMADHNDHIHVGYRPGDGIGQSEGGDIAGAASAILEGSQWDKVVGHVGAIRNPRIQERIEWHDAANMSCKYKRAMAVQAARIQIKPLASMADLAAAEKPLIEVPQLERDPRPCFGFGTPGTL
jgi:transglycosylase-like protein with SLT domain